MLATSAFFDGGAIGGGAKSRYSKAFTDVNSTLGKGFSFIAA